MLSKRRTSDAALQSYLRQEQQAGQAAILGTGSFYKRGFGINNWKLRGYFIKSDRKLVYYDPQNNETRGVVDLSSVSVTRGPEEHKTKCLKKFCNDKKNLNDEIQSSFSLLLITGHDTSNGDDTEGTGGREKMQRFELVFATVREAKMFCFAVYSVDRDISILEFIKFECWSDLIQKIDIMNAERAGRRRLSVGDSIEEEKEEKQPPLHRTRSRSVNSMPSPASNKDSSIPCESDSEDDEESKIKSSPQSHDTTLYSPLGSINDEEVRPTGGKFQVASALVMHSGWFYKKGSLHKAWQLRYFELLSSGILTYRKQAESTAEIRGHLHMLDAELLLFENMAVNVATTPLLRRDGPEVLLRKRTLHVTGYEINLQEDVRKVLISFDLEDKDVNKAAMEHFTSALIRVKSEYDRLNVSRLSIDDGSNSQPNILQSTQTKLTLHETEEKSQVPSVEGPNQRDSEVNDPELLRSVLSKGAPESDRGIIFKFLDWLRVWGQLHKETLVRVCAPLWFLSVVLLTQYPGPIALLFFTTFSVCFGSIFEPFQREQDT